MALTTLVCVCFYVVMSENNVVPFVSRSMAVDDDRRIDVAFNNSAALIQELGLSDEDVSMAKDIAKGMMRAIRRDGISFE